MKKVLCVVFFWVFSFFSFSITVKVKEVANIVGQGEIFVSGYGIVVGLKGTGDNIKNDVTKKSLANYLRNLGIPITTTNFQSKNVASVVVYGKLNPFSKNSGIFDVSVASVMDARSLEGGSLLQTVLKDENGNVVAVAQGDVIVPKGNKTKNVGVIPSGGKMITNFFSLNPLQNGNRLLLYFNSPDLNALYSLKNILLDKFENKISVDIIDPSTISISVPDEYIAGKYLDFVSEVMETEFETSVMPTIVIDQRSEALVMGGSIKVSPAVISYKGMKIEFAETGITLLESGEIYYIQGNSIADFVDFMYKNGFKAEDIINIIILLNSSGAIKANIKVM